MLEALVIENSLLRMKSVNEVFRDESSILPSENIFGTIEKAIEDTNLAVFLWTNNIDGSKYIKIERELAGQERELQFFNEESNSIIIVDIVVGKLKQSLKDRLKEHGSSHKYIEFKSKGELNRNISCKLQQLDPLIEEMKEKMKENPKPSKEAKLKRWEVHASALVSAYEYDRAISLYMKAHTLLGDHENDDTLREQKIRLEKTIFFVYSLSGKYQKAIDWYRDTLSEMIDNTDKEQEIGGKSSVLEIKNGLASAYRAIDQYKKAEELYNDTKDEAENLYKGAKAAEKKSKIAPFLVSLNGLAKVYRARGQYEKAKKMYEDAERESIDALGINDPVTLSLQNNLALVYWNLGDYEKALKLYIDLKKRLKQRYGNEHNIETISCSRGIALVYLTKKEYDQAEQLYVEIKGISERVLGKEHKETLKCSGDLARVYNNQGRYEKAEELYDDIIEKSEKRFGEEHQATLTFKNGLASAYFGKGDYETAIELFYTVKRISEDKEGLGENHRVTIASVRGLAKTYYAQGHLERAKEFYEEEKKKSVKGLGAKHSSTLKCIWNLAEVYIDLQNYGEVSNLCKELGNVYDTLK